jgi:hypothetical protein
MKFYVLQLILKIFKASNGSIVCLADLCPIFRCDVLLNKITINNNPSCLQSDMIFLRDRCNVRLNLVKQIL